MSSASFCFSLELGETLGEGAFGQVRKGYAIGLWGRLDPIIVAVKMLKSRCCLTISCLIRYVYVNR